ncbi:unnamed protein product [marine sediment metagenome]|uniref:Uncharacterized protein n=1 Tax=marine sediment metagenome TaxID=412755 RepID=X0YQY8_9ZZZZ
MIIVIVICYSYCSWLNIPMTEQMKKVARFEQRRYEAGCRREEAYIQARIKENRKWHSWWRWLF